MEGLIYSLKIFLIENLCQIGLNKKEHKKK